MKSARRVTNEFHAALREECRTNLVAVAGWESSWEPGRELDRAARSPTTTRMSATPTAEPMLVPMLALAPPFSLARLRASGGYLNATVADPLPMLAVPAAQ